MNACISPGPSRCSSLRWPSTIVASLRAAPRHVAGAGDRLRLRATSDQQPRPGGANSVPLTASAAASATAATGEPMRPSPS